MLDAGASLLQVYTGFVYGGPGLVGELNRLTQHTELERIE
jgi:dihydroorotate dehydrogenase